MTDDATMSSERRSALVLTALNEEIARLTAEKADMLVANEALMNRRGIDQDFEDRVQRAEAEVVRLTQREKQLLQRDNGWMRFVARTGREQRDEVDGLKRHRDDLELQLAQVRTQTLAQVRGIVEQRFGMITGYTVAEGMCSDVLRAIDKLAEKRA